MPTAPSNLSELTVTCRQCGSAGMERIGPREYRCTHCGAITVVSQESDAQHATAGIDTSGLPLRPAPSSELTPAQIARAEAIGHAAGRHKPALLFFVCILLAIFFIGMMHACGGDDHPVQSANEPIPPAHPAVSADKLSVSPVEWSNDVSGAGRSASGRYTGLITNKSEYALTVPAYSMSLFLRGVRVDSVASTVPLATLLPGEYEPISFAFKSPSDDPHPEMTAPALADKADAVPVRLRFTEQQLVRQDGVRGYRVVGVVNNDSAKPAKNITVAVMLFDAKHALVGFGSHKVTRALRPGERTAVEIEIATSNVNLVASYEFLIDAVPDTP